MCVYSRPSAPFSAVGIPTHDPTSPSSPAAAGTQSPPKAPARKGAAATAPEPAGAAVVAATSALERSRAIALDYADRARACLDGHVHREELEALTHLVVDRES